MSILGPHPDTVPFRARRERLLASMHDAVLVLPAAGELYKSRDTEIRYRQDSDLYYLSGFPEPEVVLVLTPFDPAQRCTLFVRPRDPGREVWNGFRYGVEGAREHFGADAVYPIEELDDRLGALLEPAERILYPLGTNAAFDARIIEQLAHCRRTRPRTGRGPVLVEDPGVRLDEMRLIKDEMEIAALRRAAEISAAGHRAAMAAARPGVGEWELEAGARGRLPPRRRARASLSLHRRGGPQRDHAALREQRPPRRGGRTSCSSMPARNGACTLAISAAPSPSRAASASRSGRFYEVVLAAEEAAIAVVRPGARIADVHRRHCVFWWPGCWSMDCSRASSMR